jgi:hypothetical protein
MKIKGVAQMKKFNGSLALGLILVAVSAVFYCNATGTIHGTVKIFNKSNLPLTLQCESTFNVAYKCPESVNLSPVGESSYATDMETSDNTVNGYVGWSVAASSQNLVMHTVFDWMSYGVNANLPNYQPFQKVVGSQINPRCSEGQSSIVGFTNLTKNGSLDTGESMMVISNTYCDNSGDRGNIQQWVFIGPVWPAARQARILPDPAQNDRGSYLYDNFTIPNTAKSYSSNGGRKIYMYYGVSASDKQGRFMEAHTESTGKVVFTTYKTVLNANCSKGNDDMYTCSVDDFVNNYMTKLPMLGYSGMQTYLSSCKVDTNTVSASGNTSSFTATCIGEKIDELYKNVCSNLNITGTNYQNMNGHIQHGTGVDDCVVTKQ